MHMVLCLQLEYLCWNLNIFEIFMPLRRIGDYMRRKRVAPIYLFIFVFIFAFIIGCSREEQGVNPYQTSEEESTSAPSEFGILIFNRMEEDAYLNVSPMPADFTHQLTHEQLEYVFPHFDIEYIHSAHAYYEGDGGLIEVGASLFIDRPEHEEWWPQVKIHIGVGAIHFDLSGPAFGANDSLGLPDDLEGTYLHGTFVRAVIVENEWSMMRHFQAEFEIDDILFRVKFTAYEEEGKETMYTIVNNLILGGTEGLQSLSDPVIPELRSEGMNLEEARLDPDFGHLVPSDAPYPFQFYFGNRSITQHWNSLDLGWEAQSDLDYLLEVYDNWVAGRSINTPVFDFDEIFWGELTIYWSIRKADEFDFNRIVSINEPERYDLSLYPLVQWEDDWLRFHELPPYESIHEPVFLAEEITFEAVASRQWKRVFITQGAYDDEGGADMRDVFIPTEFYEMDFGILFGDVVISIRTQGITAEELWVMIESVL